MERGSLREFLNATTRHGFNSCGWYKCGTLTGRGCLLTSASVMIGTTRMSNHSEHTMAADSPLGKSVGATVTKC